MKVTHSWKVKAKNGLNVSKVVNKKGVYKTPLDYDEKSFVRLENGAVHRFFSTIKEISSSPVIK